MSDFSGRSGSVAPTISVITPTFNDSPYLTAALESLAKQTFTDFECIVVDDGSTDDTAGLVKSFAVRDARFKYIYREHEGSPGTARNLAVQHAKGRILIFHDSDDIAMPQRLAQIQETFDESPNLGVVYHDYSVFDHNDPTHEHRYFQNRYKTPSGIIYKDLYGIGGLHTTASAAVLAVHYRQLGGQRARTELEIGEDYEFFLRISPKVPCTYIDASLLRQRRRKPKHLSADVILSLISRLRALDYFEASYPELMSEIATFRDPVRSQLLLSLGKAYLWRGEDSSACLAFRDSLKNSSTISAYLLLGATTLGTGRLLRWAHAMKSRRSISEAIVG